MNQQPPGVDELWIQHQRRNAKTTQSWACTHCLDRRIFINSGELWAHALLEHRDRIPSDEGEQRRFRSKFEAESSEKKRTTKDDWQPRKPNLNEVINARPEPPPPHGKRPLSSPQPTRSLSGLGQLNIGGTPYGSDIAMQDVSEDSQAPDQPRKRAAIGDGISAGSASPFQGCSASPPRRRFRTRPTSAPGRFEPEPVDPQRSHAGNNQLWLLDYDVLVSKPPLSRQSQPRPTPARRRFPSETGSRRPSEEPHIITQPDSRPISQEQTNVEMKRIYAGLVMAEAKCIEADNMHTSRATSATRSSPQASLNNEQWQALIALHRTLLHEHHDFFLVSQHLSASPALKRLAAKYAHPAQICSCFIGPDHILAFRYLAYSTMTLLYDTGIADQYSWLKYLESLERHRMVIEDDDIHDRWLDITRHWRSKCLDEHLITEGLYHHLAILACLQGHPQSFHHAKSLCVAVPFTSARESIFDLFATARHLTTKYTMLANQTPWFTRSTMGQDYHITFANYATTLRLLHGSDHITPFRNQSRGNSDMNKPSVTQYLHERDQCHTAIASTGACSLVAISESRGLSIHAKPIAISNPQRIGDSFVLPFIHVTLVFNAFMLAPRAIKDTLQFILQLKSGLKLPIRSFACPLADVDDVPYEERTSQCYPDQWASPQENSILRNDAFMRYRHAFTYRLSKKFLSFFALFCSLRGVASLPIESSSNGTYGLTNYLAYQERMFKEQIAGPLVLNLIWAFLLLLAFLTIKLLNQGWWQGRGLVRITAPSVAVSAFFLGKGDKMEDWPLVFLWIFSFGLNIEFLKTELRPFPKSRGLVAFLIMTSGAISAAWISCSATFEDRYKDPWNAGAMLSLPATASFELTWLAVIMMTGFAKKLERGMYNVALFEYIKDIVFTREIAHVDRISNAERGIRIDRTRTRRRTYSVPLPTRQRTRTR